VSGNSMIRARKQKGGKRKMEEGGKEEGKEENQSYLISDRRDLSSQLTGGSNDEELGVGLRGIDASEEGEEVGQCLAGARVGVQDGFFAWEGGREEGKEGRVKRSWVCDSEGSMRARRGWREGGM